MEQLNELDSILKDKRNEKRSDTKKERRNRHYIKILIKHQLTRTPKRAQYEDETSAP
jgi:hypothetical protein